MKEATEERGLAWQVWVDTGGTFTDCVACDPGGSLHRAKVLSSSALRGSLTWRDAETAVFDAGLELPDGFFKGGRLRLLSGGGASVTNSQSVDKVLTIDRELPAFPSGVPAEVSFGVEAPVLAAHVVTRTPVGRPLPELALRLATTRGTNALLERQGAAVAFFVTAGFRDLLLIGNQQRPDLFALDIEGRQPFYERVIEVDERLDADGKVVRALELESVESAARAALDSGIDCAAVALLHSYRNPAHELAVAARLEALGFRHVSVSSSLAARLQILPRAETAVVNAYLSDAIEAYLSGVRSALAEGTLHVMTSAGGLIGAVGYEPRDSLLSGPAGGVVGAAAAGRAAGEERVIAFDMGGTSTDVSRVGRRLDYRHETRVGGARLMAPALAIETVAAGGGSICWFDGAQVRVGPQSAGADPGPACYGAGGPLSLTDVNLLLGRLDPERFVIPLEVSAAERAAGELLDSVSTATDERLDRDMLLAGLLTIANERMAEAIRGISIRRGYSLADHALVAFGGAGGQHATALASILGMSRIIIPPDAGVLSAVGLGAARLERFAECSVLAPLSSVEETLAKRFGDLEREAFEALGAEGVDKSSMYVVRRTAEVRLLGQEAALTVDWDGGSLSPAFGECYRALYGYEAPQAAIEVESLRLVAAEHVAAEAKSAVEVASREADPAGRRRVWIGGAWGDRPTYERRALQRGDRFSGPALVTELHSATVIGSEWSARLVSGGALVAEREGVSS